MRDDLDEAAAGSGLHTAYQPIVSLPDERVIGFEALARWPRCDDPDPQAVFERAAATDMLDTLDRLCIESAIAGASAGELARGTVLLVNAEPDSAYVGCGSSATVARGHEQFTLVFELTERRLLAHPHALLKKVAAARADGIAIALDDVGSNPDSLALLDVICPDIVKLDIDLIQAQPSFEQARTLAAVLAHHERTGATILAEGIETNEHLEHALAMGATLGQGFRFGEPGPLDRHTAHIWPVSLNHSATQLSAARSPFDLVHQESRLRTAHKPTLTAFTQHIESQASNTADPPMVLTALQKAEYFTEDTARRYQQIAQTSPLVAVFGQDLPENLGPRVRGVSLAADDPLSAEWTVVVLGPHAASALLGRERVDDCEDDAGRRFDFVITYDRALVTLAARSLLDRMR
ncbi:EAL domain-containing protein [Mycolicibacterium moriokaense]|nr:EAL domain-containing protein [Mycolicibacterium moriokaense]